MRVLLAGGGTGGHLMPALALAQALREARPDVEPVLVGALRGIEAQVLPRQPFRFHLVPIEPIHRRAWASIPRSAPTDRKSTRLNSSHLVISYAVFCLKKKTSDTK